MTIPTIHSFNQFHPVGHGTFFTGRIATEEREFVWGYDCGSKRPNLVGDVAARLARNGSGKTIELFCISHFDEDHVNGLKVLLKTFRIRYLALPYLPFDVRLALAVRLGEGPASPEAALFILDPVQFLSAIGAADTVDTILFVKGNRKPAADGAPYIGDQFPSPGPQFGPKPEQAGDDRGWVDENYPALSATAGRLSAGTPRVAIHDHSVPFRPPALSWEFVFFNRSLPKMRAPKSGVSISKVQADVRQALRSFRIAPGVTDSTVSGWLAALRQCYERHFGNTARTRNDISLCLYSRPVPCGLIKPCALFDLPLREIGCAHLLAPFSTGGKGGVLLTGDIRLDVRTCDRMRRHYGEERWHDIHLMQIPHHGSKYSWRPGVASTCSHVVSVFCVPDNNPSGKHPHLSVQVDLQDTITVSANYSQSVVHAFHMEELSRASGNLLGSGRRIVI